ncbi:hypothetical protein JMJ58_24435 (plasmid) [Haloterrigena salifodinae]|uniref:Secreted glycoprotein n=1 Tax=Haloterrigena salifodinae TaxID=2675099 RepID=A0A8T8E8U0_9EURY|nr:hypothetical protein [Haloterrigena salifodinae]QRV18073.1 hypothetical protein JMJ58_24435 [Haloterrigena salifodinae]
MTRDNHHLSRRTALRTVAGAALASVAGCLDSNGSTTPNGSESPADGSGVFQQVTVDGTALVVEFAADSEFDQINLIQPNGELFGQREVAAGSQQVSFDLGTSYSPGEYEVVALKGEEEAGDATIAVQPEIQVREVGLYRNNPDKPWDEVYGDTETNRLKNGEAFVTVENTGSGPDAAIELIFSGDVPNPVDDPRGSGMYETEQVLIPPGETRDLFSNSYPFGSESDEGMGCSPEGNSGQFTVTVETQIGGNQVSNTFDVQYSGSTEMSDCEVSITEA